MPWVTINVVGEVCSISPSKPASLNIWVVIGGGGPLLTPLPPQPARLMATQAMPIANVLTSIIAVPLVDKQCNGREPVTASLGSESCFAGSAAVTKTNLR